RRVALGSAAKARPTRANIQATARETRCSRTDSTSAGVPVGAAAWLDPRSATSGSLFRNRDGPPGGGPSLLSLAPWSYSRRLKDLGRIVGVHTRMCWHAVGSAAGRPTVNSVDLRQRRSSVSPLIPMVVEQTSRGERAFDIYSRLL